MNPPRKWYQRVMNVLTSLYKDRKTAHDVANIIYHKYQIAKRIGKLQAWRRWEADVLTGKISPMQVPNFDPENPERPPRKWFYKMLSKIMRQYPREKGESKSAWMKDMQRIVAGIWHQQYRPKTKRRMLRYAEYEGMTPEKMPPIPPYFDREALSALVNDLEGTYQAIEIVIPIMRKDRMPDYLIRYASLAQEAINEAKHRLQDFLGALR